MLVELYLTRLATLVLLVQLQFGFLTSCSAYTMLHTSVIRHCVFEEPCCCGDNVRAEHLMDTSRTKLML